MRVVTAVSPSVVQIRTPEDFGSGVVVDDRGDVVTNAYVVGNGTRFVVTLASGASHPATAIGRSAELADLTHQGPAPPSRAVTIACGAGPIGRARRRP